MIERYQKVGKDAKGPSIQRYDLTGRQILIYLANLAEGQPLSFSYCLRARFPLAVHSPASSAYDYYNPSVAGEGAPIAIEVKP
jgi:CD109 antigen